MKNNLSTMRLIKQFNGSDVKEIKLVNDEEWNKEYLIIIFKDGKRLDVCSAYNYSEGETYLDIEEVE